jgi:signal transduction histidine kinase
MKWPARGSLVWRLYALGLAQLVLLAASLALIGSLLGPWAPLATFFAGGVLTASVGALLSWRWMVRPVAHLSRVARSLVAGDLSARAGLPSGDEIGELGRGLDDMAERIEGLVLTQKELLANVSHELRTPLARIRVALDIASEGDAGTARASLAEISVDLAELEGMIADILTTTRMDLQMRSREAASFSLRCGSVAPGSIVEHASARFRARHPERDLRVAVADDLPSVHVDARLFRRVLDNLLDNAHEYSPPERSIGLGVRREREQVVFEVSDEGIGIAPSDLARVFDPFFRAERSRSRGTGGVGLGLTLAKRIVDAHGGCIELDSAAARGTRARVHLGPGPHEAPQPAGPPGTPAAARVPVQRCAGSPAR